MYQLNFFKDESQTEDNQVDNITPCNLKQELLDESPIKTKQIKQELSKDEKTSCNGIPVPPTSTTYEFKNVPNLNGFAETFDKKRSLFTTAPTKRYLNFLLHVI